MPARSHAASADWSGAPAMSRAAVWGSVFHADTSCARATGMPGTLMSAMAAMTTRRGAT